MTFFAFANESENPLGVCTLTSFLKDAPSQDIVQNKIVLIIFQTILLPFAIFVNVLFLKAYYNNQRLHSTSNILLVNLSISNFFHVSFALPLNICRQILEILGKHECLMWDIQQCSFLYFSALSFVSLFLISYERFIALFFPLRHIVICDIVKVKRAVFVAWVGCASMMGLLYVGAFIFYCVAAAFLTITLILVGFMYWKIFLQARKQRRNIFAERKSIIQNLPGLAIGYGNNRKAEKSVGCVLGFMLLCNLPSVLFLVYATFFGYSLYGMYVLSPWGDFFLFINASFNPFVYCWRNRPIRQAMLNILVPKN